MFRLSSQKRKQESEKSQVNSTHRQQKTKKIIIFKNKFKNSSERND